MSRRGDCHIRRISQRGEVGYQLAWLLKGNGRAARSILEEPFALTASKGTATMSGPLSLASTLSEDLLLEYTEGMSGQTLGWGRLTAANLLQVMSLHTAYADLMRRTPYLARTRGSNLLSYVVKWLEQAANGKAQAPLLVIAGHDTNLSNLSGMLGFRGFWPATRPMTRRRAGPYSSRCGSRLRAAIRFGCSLLRRHRIRCMTRRRCHRRTRGR